MRVALISDTHWGITKPKTISKMLHKLAATEQVDVLVHAGDYCGVLNASGSVRATTKLMRASFPSIPIISVLGNHDYWCNDRRTGPTLRSWQANLESICRSFGDAGIHWLDEKGPLLHNGVWFFGHSGWYTNPNPPTNDITWMPPHIEGGTHAYLLKQAYDAVFKQMESLPPEGIERVFVSHFPVIKVGDDYKGRFEDFSWSEALGKALQGHGVRFFLNGHAHSLHKGPLRYEAGSDYHLPRYSLIDIPSVTDGGTESHTQKRGEV